MSEAVVSVNGHRVTHARVIVGARGAWVAELTLEQAPELSGRVTIKLAELTLSGTTTDDNGTFGLQRKVQVVGGAAGWSKDVAAKDYHSDGGVKARTLAEDAARAVGESISGFVPSAERVGVHYARPNGPASHVLERAAGSAGWWVDFDGNTHVGTRPETKPAPDAYQVLAFDPLTRIATVAADDARSINVGSVLSKGLDAPQTVRELEIVASEDGLRFMCWCGGSAQSSGQLTDLLRALVDHYLASKLFGSYRYRVVRMSVDRVELQAVRKAAGLPDQLPISFWPGVAGTHAELTPGAEVLVEFLEGDPTQPVVTHFAGKDGKGFLPITLAICEGLTPAPAAARVGDNVQVTLPPGPFSGLLNGVTPISGTITWAPPAIATGTIVSGSAKVRIG